MKSKYLIIVITMLFTTACATSSDSMLLGAGIGGVVGTATGYGVGEDAKGAIIGGTIGMATGALFGYLAHRAESQKKSSTALPAQDPKYPFLNKPEVQRMWIEDKILDSGSKYEMGHWLFIINKSSSWSKP